MRATKLTAVQRKALHALAQAPLNEFQLARLALMRSTLEALCSRALARPLGTSPIGVRSWSITDAGRAALAASEAAQ